MSRNDIFCAPIWDDIKTLGSADFFGNVDIIYGGFPCQDISVAGRGAGLAGQRSGLFFEIVRLAKEIKPTFIFLENVPAICSRGGTRVTREITEMGYDCRWCVISAASIGALHRRERWFCLAYAKHDGSYGTEERGSSQEAVYNDKEGTNKAKQSKRSDQSRMLATESVSNTSSLRCDKRTSEGIHTERQTGEHEKSSDNSGEIFNYWQNTEPPVCGIPNGIPHRVDRIKSLGNAVVPSQAKEAFKILMGLK
jgi:DNA (cytosine-5)-methyltransferase 1